MFTNNYDIIIVGGGISGLFMAYKLSSTDVSILLVEKQKKLGGRIQTLKKNKLNLKLEPPVFIRLIKKFSH